MQPRLDSPLPLPLLHLQLNLIQQLSGFGMLRIDARGFRRVLQSLGKAILR